MIKFFRKIRQNLLTENKVSKYILYSLGEIMLVVIGILIALQLNNWNEDRKQNETLDSIFTIIKEDLESDIDQMEIFINNFEKIRAPIFDTLLYANLTIEELNKNPKYSKVFLGYEDIDMNIRGYDLLKNQPTVAQIKSPLVSKISEFYNEHLIEIEIAQLELAEEFWDNNRKWKTYDWNVDFLIFGRTEEYYKFILNDPEARKRMATYYLYFNIYLNELKLYKKDAEQLIQEIKNFS